MKEYFMPVKVVMGTGCVKDHKDYFGQFGKKALIVTGRHSAKACGALDDVTGVLEENGQSFVIYDQVMNNPTVECVYEGGALARREQADFVIAIGGGSPMDAAKAIALLAVNEIPKEEIFSGVSQFGALPMLHVATTAGTGSEVTPYAILTNPGRETKTSISGPALFPKYAFLDHSYLEKLPEKSMKHTVIDSLSHSVEGMFSVRASEVTDGLALAAIGMIAGCFSRLLDNALTEEDKSCLLRASAMGGMVISATGTTIVHSMGYSLTYFHGTDHGRANGLLLAAFLQVAERTHKETVKRILTAMGYTQIGQLKEVLDGLLGEKERLTEQEKEKYTKLASGSKNIRNCRVPITGAEIREIFENSL